MDYREPNVERLIAAYKKKKYDRVPNWDFMDAGPIRRIMEWGEEKENVNRNDFLTPEDAVSLAQKTHQDTISVNLHYTHTDLLKGEICSVDDFDKILPPNPEFARQKILQALDAVRGTNIGVCVLVAAPFFITYCTVGPIPIQSFMLKLYDDLPFVEELMEIHLKNQVKIIEAIEDLPVSVVEIADDVCLNTGYFVPPRFMKKIWEPRAEKLVNAVKRMNVPIQWHCCGKLDDVMPLFVKWGIDAVAPIQPACNDIYKLKKEWGDYLCLVGNINMEGVLAFGTPDEVVEDTREHIERLSYNGGYVVASSHSIVDAIPVENYNAMIETAVKYGRF